MADVSRDTIDAKAAEAPRILFFGWGAAAAIALRCIATEIPAATVRVISGLSQADDAPLDQVAAQHAERGLHFECCLTDDNSEVYRLASEFAPTLILSASYRKKIKIDVLNLCRDALNFHPSLLPKHRGCFSGFWSIHEGDSETGVTCHRMVEKFDEGRIIYQERMPLSGDETSASLYKKLLPVTGDCVSNVLRLVASGTLPEGSEQTPGEGSYHFRNLPFGGEIQPEWDDATAERYIRAMIFPPFKGAVLRAGDRTIEVNSLPELHAARRELFGETAP
jgi:methionyl-tRNA formyltransferase